LSLLTFFSLLLLRTCSAVYNYYKAWLYYSTVTDCSYGATCYCLHLAIVFCCQEHHEQATRGKWRNGSGSSRVSHYHRQMWPDLTKPVLSPILKHRETTALKIQCVITRQWLKLHLPNFHTFYTNSLPSRPPTVEESSCQVSHYFREFFYSMLTVSGVFQHGWVVGAGGGQDGDFKVLKGKVYGCIRPSYGPHKPLNWLKWREIRSRHLYSIPQSCAATHNHPKASFGYQTAHTDCHYALEKPLCFRKAASKSRPLKCIACFDYEFYEFIHVPSCL